MPRLDPARLLDAAEGVGEEFSEATEHVGRMPEFSDLSLGPLVEIPFDELSPGAIGWRRAVSRRAGASRGRSDPPPAASLGCVVVPSTPDRSPQFRPLRTAQPEDLVIVPKEAAWPHRVLTARSGGGIAAGTMRRLAEAVARELA